MEQLKIKGKRGTAQDDHFILDLNTFSKYLPHLALLKHTLGFFHENNLELHKLKSSLNNSPVKKMLKDYAWKEEDWLKYHSNDELDRQYINITTGFFQFLLPAIFKQMGIEVKSIEELEKSFYNKSRVLAEQIFTFFNIDILKSLKEKTWEIGKEGERIFQVNQNSNEDKKQSSKNGKIQTIQTAQLKKTCEVIYLYMYELMKYIEDTKQVSVLKKDDIVEYTFKNSNVEGVEYIPLLLSIDTLLYAPYPDKNKILVIQYHIRKISKISKSMPQEFYEILVKIYHFSSSFISLQHRNFKILEKHYKNLVRTFWRKTKNLEKAVVWQLVCAIDNTFSQTKLYFEYYDNNVKNSMGESLSHLKHTFLRGRKTYFEGKINSPVSFWLEFSMIANLKIQDKKDNIRIFDLYKTLIAITKNKKVNKQNVLNITLSDYYVIYKRIIYHGLQSGKKDYKDQIESEIKKLEKIIEKIEENETVKGAWIEDRGTIIRTFRDSLKAFAKEEKLLSV